MESRFRKLLLRRDRPTTAEEDPVVGGLPYQNSDPETYQPIFIYQPLGKSTTELRKSVQANGLPLRSFSYESAAQGKAPVMGARPHKGNGPIKLQTNRRLSNGELIATTQDVQQTLKDIKEGDYIVGRKERPLSQSVQRRSSSTVPQLPLPPALDVRFGQLRQSLIAPSHSHTWPLATVHEQTTLSPTITSDSEFTVDPHPGHPSPSASHSKTSVDVPYDTFPQLSQSSALRDRPGSYADSFQDPPQEQNATLRALYKAEYSRLVTIYGQVDADRSIAQLDRERTFSQQYASSANNSSQAMRLLEPLPKPSFDTRSLELRRTSAMSGNSARSSGTWSETSSRHKQSPASSCAEVASSITQPHMDDAETAGTRADVRKMVERMRSTFISAYEEQAPKHVKPRPPKKKRNPKLVAAPQLTTSSIPTSAPGLGLDQDVWQDSEIEAETATQLHTTNQQYPSASPLSSTQTLSAQSGKEETGIRRADSSTLGTIMAERTREKLRSRHRHSGGSKARDRKSRQSEKSTDGSVEGSFTTASSFHPLTPTHSPDLSSESWLNVGVDSWDEVYAPLTGNYLSSPQPIDIRTSYNGGRTKTADDAHTGIRSLYKNTSDSAPDLTYIPTRATPFSTTSPNLHNKEPSISAFPTPPQTRHLPMMPTQPNNAASVMYI